MGALMRATVAEVDEIYATDAAWWPGFCGAVAERGQVALREERDLRGWSWGALWRWIQDDPKRAGEYQAALEAYSQDLALETVGIADGAGPEEVASAKLRVDTRFRLAGKVDRARWGDEVKHTMVVDAFGDMLRRVSERKLAELRAAQAPAIEGSAVVVSETLAHPAVSEEDI